MRKTTFLLTIILLFVVSAFAGEVTLLKRTIYITPQKFLRYWKNPKAAEPIYNTNCWYPKVTFDVLGPIESESKLYVEFDRANGTLWMKVNMQTPTLEEDVFEKVRTENIDSNDEEKLASIESGTFNFRIKMKNTETGTDKVLFSGKFKVNQLALDQNIPENKGKKEFMVDYDWHLPIGYIWLNPQGDAEVPYLSTQVCLKGKIEPGKVEGYLFFNGKEIGKAPVSPIETLTSGADEAHHRYTIMEVDFGGVRGFNKSSSMNDFANNFFLDKNMGNYEIKILRNNQLVRAINFSVGTDGKIIDNGFAKNAKLGGVRLIFPAQITGALDGQFNPAAWQTDAIFGNPLSGFSVQ